MGGVTKGWGEDWSERSYEGVGEGWSGRSYEGVG